MPDSPTPGMVTNMKELGARELPRVTPDRFREISDAWPDEVPGCFIVARTLAEEGLFEGFSVFGWDYMFMWTIMGQLGFTIYHHRHDQAPAWGAGGYAIGKCAPGFAIVDRRPGMVNLHAGLGWAHGARVPMVVICTTAPLTWMERGGAQEYNVDRTLGSMWDGVCKWAHRVLDIHDIAYWIRKAKRECIMEPRGPCVVQVPSNFLIARHNHRVEYQLFDAVYGGGTIRAPEISQGGGRIEDVEKVVDMLLNAERPMIVTGSAVYYSQAGEELKELVELTQIPVHCRRQSRGSVPENHPLHFHGGPRPVVFAETDAVLIVGLELNFLEGFGFPPLWNAQAKYAVVQEHPDLHYLSGTPFGTQVSILGNVKQVLRQIIEVAKTKVSPEKIERHQGFVKKMQEIKEAYFNTRIVERVSRNWGVNPCLNCISPCSARDEFLRIGAVDWEVLAYEAIQEMQANDSRSSIIIDSFSMSDVCTDKFFANFPGTTADCGIHMGVGHSLGIGIGLQVARPGRASMGFCGDAGFSVGMGEMETMMRYKLPHMTLLCNNQAWGGRSCVEAGFYLRPWLEVSWQNWPGFVVRYDEMFKPLGVHTEFITAAEHVRPAVRRAMESGKPALLHALGDCSATPPLIVVLAIYHTWSWGMKPSDFAPGIQKDIAGAGVPFTVATMGYLNGYGIYPPLDELIAITGADKGQCEDVLRANGIPFR
ncbi:MAG: thiamine pyrophosphate-dependent enzyme [Dehalococcoidia bacterium]